ncbi:hypothetical protein [Phyllobacterium sp. YR531]|uniref:hypothetical protein n=1 Tax=Phyllobacterium sp. YR531 TaxID=1144343 RepID=UPI00026FC374|nr:hypothetical protein [Phyllobacterium sp. YR531]EJN04294.1 hypothetical protein PMI41_01933 [Phyllobacterium sp. YR531]
MTVYPFVSSFKDRHGKVRYRYRRGTRQISLKGEPGSPEFERQYELAANGISNLSDNHRANLIDRYVKSSLKRARTRSARQLVPMDITEPDVVSLLELQGWRCSVSGIPFPLKNVDQDRSNHAFRPSLDRVFPHLGYTKGNVRIVCEIVNLAMNNWGEGPLLTLVKEMRANALAN